MIPKNDELEKTKISNSLEQFSGDLNTIKTTGFTYATGTASNIPVAGYSFYITTIALNEYYTYQEARRVDENTNNFNTYERQCYGGNWTDWRHIDCQKITTGVEFETGRIIDGKKEYGKRVRLGNLPNNEMKYVAHGISNITFTKIEGICDNGLGDRLTLPYINIDSLGASILMYIDGADIRIKTYSDKSTYVGYATLYYTKN